MLRHRCAKAGYLLGLDRAGEQLSLNSAANISGQSGLRYYAGKVSKTIAAAPAEKGADAAEFQAIAKRLEEYRKKPVSDKAEYGQKDAQEARQLAEDLDKVAGRLEGAPKEAGAAKELRQVATEIRAQANKVQEAAETAQNIRHNLKAATQEAKEAQKHDSAVAFATAPAAAKLGMASANIGQANVKSVWAYQGSRPLPYGKTLLLIQGDTFRALTPGDEKVIWENKLTSSMDATRPATPPALAGGKVYFATADGRVVCADPKTGKTVWESVVGGRILFQPAVMNGRVYVATDDGTLICLETGDASADGWSMWGGSAQHNGPAGGK